MGIGLLFQAGQGLLQIFRELGMKFHPFLGSGQAKTKGMRVQEVALKLGAKRLFPVPVECISGEWMANVGEMHADLVGAACNRMDFY